MKAPIGRTALIDDIENLTTLDSSVLRPSSFCQITASRRSGVWGRSSGPRTNRDTCGVGTCVKHLQHVTIELGSSDRHDYI